MLQAGMVLVLLRQFHNVCLNTFKSPCPMLSFHCPHFSNSSLYVPVILLNAAEQIHTYILYMDLCTFLQKHSCS